MEYGGGFVKFKHKEFVIGFVLASIVYGGFTIFADDLLNISPNPFKIKVDGVEKNIEGYNINDNSYFKLRDIGEQVGFDVDFEDGVIMIDTQTVETEANVVLSPDNEVQIVDDHTISKDGKVYITVNYIYNSALLKNTSLLPDDSGSGLYVYRQDTNEKLSESIPYIVFTDRWFVSEDDFQNLVLPLDKE